jgi:hypothetical protein
MELAVAMVIENGTWVRDKVFWIFGQRINRKSFIDKVQVVVRHGNMVRNKIRITDGHRTGTC